MLESISPVHRRGGLVSRPMDASAVEGRDTCLTWVLYMSNRLGSGARAPVFEVYRDERHHIGACTAARHDGGMPGGARQVTGTMANEQR